MNEACEKTIVAHLRRYRAENDHDRVLELMAPSHYGEFARQACRDVAAIVASAVNTIQSGLDQA